MNNRFTSVALLIIIILWIVSVLYKADLVTIVESASLAIILTIAIVLAIHVISRNGIQNIRPSWLRCLFVMPKNPPNKIQFSLARLLLAVTVVAIVFSVFRSIFGFKEVGEVIPAAVISLGLGGLTLIGGRSEIKLFFTLIALVIATGILLFLLCCVAYFTAR